MIEKILYFLLVSLLLTGDLSGRAHKTPRGVQRQAFFTESRIRTVNYNNKRVNEDFSDKESANTKTNTNTDKSLDGENAEQKDGGNPYKEQEKDSRPHEQSGEPASHIHNWEVVYKTVHHDAVYELKDMGSYVEKEVEAAFDEPVYECRTFCNKCGADITGEDAVAHSALCKSGYHDEYIVVGFVHHEPRYEMRWEEDIRPVEVSPAYDEKVQSGFRCISCGAFKAS